MYRRGWGEGYGEGNIPTVHSLLQRSRVCTVSERLRVKGPPKKSPIEFCRLDRKPCQHERVPPSAPAGRGGGVDHLAVRCQKRGEGGEGGGERSPPQCHPGEVPGRGGGYESQNRELELEKRLQDCPHRLKMLIRAWSDPAHGLEWRAVPI